MKGANDSQSPLFQRCCGWVFNGFVCHWHHMIPWPWHHNVIMTTLSLRRQPSWKTGHKNVTIITQVIQR